MIKFGLWETVAGKDHLCPRHRRAGPHHLSEAGPEPMTYRLRHRRHRHHEHDTAGVGGDRRRHRSEERRRIPGLADRYRHGHHHGRAGGRHPALTEMYCFRDELGYGVQDHQAVERRGDGKAYDTGVPGGSILPAARTSRAGSCVRSGSGWWARSSLAQLIMMDRRV